jgi:hypothetical protein
VQHFATKSLNSGENDAGFTTVGGSAFGMSIIAANGLLSAYGGWKKKETIAKKTTWLAK